MRDVRTFLLAPCLLAGTAIARVGQDIAYVVRKDFAGTTLVGVDPATGAELSALLSPGPPWYVQTPVSLTHDGSRLLGYGQGPANPNGLYWLYATNLATGRVGPIASSPLIGAAQPGVEFHRPSGLVYAAEYTNTSPFPRRLLTVDPIDGEWAVVGSFVGLVNNEVITKIAIDSTGTCYGISGHGYVVSLTTASVVPIGPVNFPAGGSLMDIAFDSQDRLWGLVHEFVSSSVRRYELYLIDTGSMSTTYVCDLQYSMQAYTSYYGLAFGPGVTKSTYCTAKVNSLGCAPTIAATGYPSASAEFGFTISATSVGSQSSGMLVYGVQGPAATPFGGGTLCVQTPWQRTGPMNSGGPLPAMSDCSGVWSRDFNAWLWTHTSLPPGLDVHVQWLGRDSGFAPPHHWSLSNALKFTLLP